MFFYKFFRVSLINYNLPLSSLKLKNIISLPCLLCDARRIDKFFFLFDNFDPKGLMKSPVEGSRDAVGSSRRRTIGSLIIDLARLTLFLTSESSPVILNKLVNVWFFQDVQEPLFANGSHHKHTVYFRSTFCFSRYLFGNSIYAAIKFKLFNKSTLLVSISIPQLRTFFHRGVYIIQDHSYCCCFTAIVWVEYQVFHFDLRFF